MNGDSEGTTRPLGPNQEGDIQENSYRPETSELDDNEPPTEDSSSSENNSD